MNKAMLKKYLLGGVAGVAVSLSVTGCAIAGDAKNNVPGKGADHYDTANYLPFRIAFSREGKPVFLDENGKELQGRDVKLPLEAKKIYSLESFTVGIFTGSCFMFASMGGGVFKSYPLPSSFCA